MQVVESDRNPTPTSGIGNVPTLGEIIINIVAGIRCLDDTKTEDIADEASTGPSYAFKLWKLQYLGCKRA